MTTESLTMEEGMNERRVDACGSDAPSGGDGFSGGPATRPQGRRMDRVWRLLPLGILVAGLIAFFALGGRSLVSLATVEAHREALTAFVDRAGWGAVAVYVLTYALATAFSIPGAAVLTMVGGLLFGTVPATVYVVLGATAGACAVFLAARTALAEMLRRKTQGWIARFEAGFREDAFSFLLFLRLIPIFPFWLVNLVPAFLGVPLRVYAVATLVGIIPGAFVYASVGNGVGAILDAGGRPDLGIIFSPEILIPIVGLGVLSLLPVLYKRVIRRGRGQRSSPMAGEGARQ